MKHVLFVIMAMQRKLEKILVLVYYTVSIQSHNLKCLQRTYWIYLGHTQCACYCQAVMSIWLSFGNVYSHLTYIQLLIHADNNLYNIKGLLLDVDAMHLPWFPQLCRMQHSCPAGQFWFVVQNWKLGHVERYCVAALVHTRTDTMIKFSL